MSERESANPAANSAAHNEAEITLGLLNAVHENETLTQRSAASQLGIALGLTNSYLKRCVRKGLIKMQQIPPNRYAYYLTPKGFSEKSRLTREYLSSSFTFFRRARNQCAELLGQCARVGCRRVALWGMSDLAEIAVLCAGQHELELVGVVDAAGGPGRTFFGLPVATELAGLGEVDAVLITDLNDPQGGFDRLAGTLPDDRIFAPEMLRVSRAGDGR